MDFLWSTYLWLYLSMLAIMLTDRMWFQNTKGRILINDDISFAFTITYAWCTKTCISSFSPFHFIFLDVIKFIFPWIKIYLQFILMLRSFIILINKATRKKNCNKYGFLMSCVNYYYLGNKYNIFLIKIKLIVLRRLDI